MAYYAVKVGRNPGVYKTWDECNSQVNGFPKAIYKKFSTLEEAEIFADVKNKSSAKKVKTEKKKSKNSKVSAEERAIAYTDGSAIGNHVIECGSGAIIIWKDNVVKICSKLSGPIVTSKNVTGEIYAAMSAMSFAVQNNIKEVVIYHDYEGIAKWCTGEWEANKQVTRRYREFFDFCSGKTNIKFKKVKAQSGDVYNEMADELAKKSINL